MFFLKSICSLLPVRRSKKLPPRGKIEDIFFEVISRFRAHMKFLMADLESTHKVTSIGMFFGKITHFYEELGTKSCFWSKSCFCCSRAACNCSEKTKPAVGLEMFESTPPLLGILFFWNLKYTMWATPFRELRTRVGVATSGHPEYLFMVCKAFLQRILLNGLPPACVSTSETGRKNSIIHCVAVWNEVIEGKGVLY